MRNPIRHDAPSPSGLPLRNVAAITRPAPDGTIAIADDLSALRSAIVSVFFFGAPNAGDRGWVLIDAGLPGSTQQIITAAARRFGVNARPAAIVLTHGHFDHVGALETLARQWDVPVYAHPLELPYITGRSSYPPPDPTVGGGAVARLSALYPRGPWNVGDRARSLPEDGSVPEMDGWRWLHTPGHTPGHVSLWRAGDRLLVAGDAVATTKPESLLSVATQRPELHGPPAFYTQDWSAAKQSVRAIAELRPLVLATGHGRAMRGDALPDALWELAERFDEVAVPRRGRYVDQPAVADESGTVSVPPGRHDPLPSLLVGAGAALATALLVRGARGARGTRGTRGGRVRGRMPRARH